MNTYICKNCKKPQYSASSEKANEPCVYCGASVELMEDRTERDDTARESCNGCPPPSSESYIKILSLGYMPGLFFVAQKKILLLKLYILSK